MRNRFFNRFFLTEEEKMDRFIKELFKEHPELSESATFVLSMPCNSVGVLHATLKISLPGISNENQIRLVKKILKKIYGIETTDTDARELCKENGEIHFFVSAEGLNIYPTLNDLLMRKDIEKTALLYQTLCKISFMVEQNKITEKRKISTDNLNTVIPVKALASLVLEYDDFSPKNKKVTLFQSEERDVRQYGRVEEKPHVAILRN